MADHRAKSPDDLLDFEIPVQPSPIMTAQEQRKRWVQCLRVASRSLSLPITEPPCNVWWELHMIADALEELANGDQHPALCPDKKQGRRRDLQTEWKATVAGWAQHLIDHHQMPKSHAVDMLAKWLGLEQRGSDHPGKAGKTISKWLKTYKNHPSPDLRRSFAASAQGKLLPDMMNYTFTPRSLNDFEHAVKAEWSDMCKYLGL